MARDYGQSVAAGSEVDSHAGLGNFACILASRVSHAVGLSAPFLSPLPSAMR